MSAQLHILVVLPQRRHPPVFTPYEWAQEPTWKLCERWKFLPLPGIKPRFLGHTFRNVGIHVLLEIKLVTNSHW